ncbi:MAG: AbrB/MazE/SpoVT family DNA-binding domain-containing protein [Paraclostridium sp.]
MVKSIVTKQGNNGKKINLPKIVWEKLELNPGDRVEFITNKKGEIKIKKA